VLDQTIRARRNRAAATAVVFACAASAGIRAGIVAEHLREAPRLGIAFIIAMGIELLGLPCALRLAEPIRRPTGRPSLEEVVR
jgi:hypothetical protein